MGNKDSTPRGQVMGLYYVNKVVLNAQKFGEDATSSSQAVAVDPLEVSTFMRSFMLNLKGDFISPDGHTVNYTMIRSSDKYAHFVSGLHRLHSLDLGIMDESSRKAFLLNIYNALVIHGLVENKLAGLDSMSRLKFYASVSYQIGPHIYSLNDIENGLLRCNQPSAAPFSSIPFSAQDPRFPFSLRELDPRIHFALNCGAASCPPILAYTGDSHELDNQLNMATSQFVDNTTRIEHDEKRKLVHVTISKLFFWYRSDFGGDDRAVIRWIHSHAVTLSDQLARVVGEGCEQYKLSVSYAEYDWGLNSA